MELLGHRVILGGRYSVTSSGGDEAIETTGVFRGYSALGGETAMVMEVPDGDRCRLRLIPIGRILMLEVLEDVVADEEPAPTYYG